jgi:molybdate transport system ATP-binding protein
MIRADLRLDLPGFALRAQLEIPARGVTAVFGPSGSGKTLLLRSLAGLERAARGHVDVDGQVWQDDARGLFRPTHERALGYVFQEPSLFPQQSVRRNLAFGYERTAPGARTVQWDQAVELLDIGPLLDRAPARLSGGERQRIAIARALLASPRLLLMDEPLAALDAARKREILPFLARAQRALDIPLIYVSHQIEEIAALAQHLVLLEGGRIRASGPLAQTLARVDLPIAQDEDGGVVIDAVAGAHDSRFHLTRLDFPGGQIHVPRESLALGDAVRVRIRARDVSLTLSPHEDSSVLNRFAATVQEIAGTANPANVLVRLDAGGTALLARITLRSQDRLQLAPGRQVWAQVKSAVLVT